MNYIYIYTHVHIYIYIYLFTLSRIGLFWGSLEFAVTSSSRGSSIPKAAEAGSCLSIDASAHSKKSGEATECGCSPGIGRFLSRVFGVLVVMLQIFS